MKFATTYELLPVAESQRNLVLIEDISGPALSNQLWWWLMVALLKMKVNSEHIQWANNASY